MTNTPDDEMPDWPPRDSAWQHPEGTLRHGSTGQLFQVKNKRWERVRDKPTLVITNGESK